MYRHLLATAALFSMVALVPSASGATLPGNPTLEQAVNGSWRTPAYVVRDRYRRPLQTLRFFGVRPEMTVVELAPGGGWWTEILAPYLKTGGLLIEAVPPASSTGFMQRLRTHFLEKLEASPKLYSKVETVGFAPASVVTLGPPASADRVLTFRNLHNWENEGSLESVFRAAYTVLKPGGIFGVVEHRALPFAEPRKSSKELHRLPEDFVIEMGLRTGFRLAAVSQLHANPKDPLTINVHHLPPNLHEDTAAQKKEYAAIGESDLMTLKFIKP